jgi:hypothetical protein
MTMHPNPITARDELVKYLKSNPDFVAYVLARYQEQEGISDENLPAVLGTLPELVSRLALCRKPDANVANFATSVREIADYTLVDESLLADIIRRVSSLEALSKSAEHEFLAAARDWNDVGAGNEPSPPTENPEGKK